MLDMIKYNVREVILLKHEDCRKKVIVGYVGDVQESLECGCSRASSSWKDPFACPFRIWDGAMYSRIDVLHCFPHPGQKNYHGTSFQILSSLKFVIISQVIRSYVSSTVETESKQISYIRHFCRIHWWTATVPTSSIAVILKIYTKYVNSQLHTCKLEVCLTFHIQLTHSGEMLIAFL